MKNQYKHLMLWKKREGLRIDDNAQQDWLSMRALLDEQMPVSDPLKVAGSTTLEVIKVAAIIGAIALALMIMYVVFVKGHSGTIRHTKADTMVTVNGNIRPSNPVNTGNTIDKPNPDKPTSNGSNSKTPAINAGTKTNARPDMNASATNSSAPVNGVVPAGNIKSAGKTMDHSSDGNAVANGNTMSTSGIPSANTNKKITTGDKVNNKRAAAIPATPHVAPNRVDRISAKHKPLMKGSVATGANHRGSSDSNNITGHGSAPSNRGGLGRSRGHYGTRQNNDVRGMTGSAERTGTQGNVLTNASQTTSNARRDLDIAQAVQQPQLGLNTYVDAIASFMANRFKAELDSMMVTKQKQLRATSDSSVVAKRPKVTQPKAASKLDYGILAGVNASGSFTAKNQNKNFYGSLPVDVFLGAFATYHFNDKWGLNLQLRGLNPQNISGTYTHSNDSKKDTNQVLAISDSRKVYTADAALHLVFKPLANLSFKAGPVFGWWLKEANGTTAFQTGPLKKDSAYYVGVNKLINATTYTKSLNIGLSAGASYEYGRFIFDAAYIKNFSGVKVSSTLGSYTATSDQFLFSIGFKLNKTK
jgi:hypothetical protein